VPAREVEGVRAVRPARRAEPPTTWAGTDFLDGCCEGATCLGANANGGGPGSEHCGARLACEYSVRGAADQDASRVICFDGDDVLVSDEPGDRGSAGARISDAGLASWWMVLRSGRPWDRSGEALRRVGARHTRQWSGGRRAPPQVVEECLAPWCVESGGGLVDQEQLWLERKRPRQADPLRFPRVERNKRRTKWPVPPSNALALPTSRTGERPHCPARAFRGGTVADARTLRCHFFATFLVAEPCEAVRLRAADRLNLDGACPC
jgi:hypothetical protein